MWALENKQKKTLEVDEKTWTLLCSVSSAVCRLPMSAQPCTGEPPIWAFDSSAGLCVPYKVDFCQANANKFYSKAECDEYCGVVKEGEMINDTENSADTGHQKEN